MASTGCCHRTLRQWTRKLWDFDRPCRHPGKRLGTSTQIGMSLGVAPGHNGSGRVVVAIQPDGDLMYGAGALWTAAKHEIPLLIVMFNNRAYYNEWDHQIRMARLRGTDEGLREPTWPNTSPRSIAISPSLPW